MPKRASKAIHSKVRRRLCPSTGSGFWRYKIIRAAANRPKIPPDAPIVAPVFGYKCGGLGEIVTENLFDKIHGDPRWLPFLRKAGKAPEQLARSSSR